MFSTLRARLWLSYALLILLLLAVVAVGIAWAFLRAPRVLYPDVVFRLQTVNETTARDVALSLRADPSGKKIEPFLRSQAASRGLRIVIITGKNHRVLFDTG